MKVEELRIGNLAQTPKGSRYNGIIKAWNLSMFYWITECVDNIEDFKPIPLTEEVLLDCGLQKWKNKNIWTLKGVMIYRMADGFLYYGRKSLRTKLEHVHHLQNLYFALTGQELEFKTLGK